MARTCLVAHIAIEHHVNGLGPRRIAQLWARLQGCNPFGLPVGIGLPRDYSFQVLADARIGRQVLERAKGYFQIGFCLGLKAASETGPKIKPNQHVLT